MPVPLRARLRVPLIALACASCAAPAMDFDPALLEASLERRAEDATELEEALALADVFRPALWLPAPEERATPEQDGYWDARALAFSPAVRQARRAWRAARASRSSAGAPGPFRMRAMDHEFGGDDTLFETVGLFDLIGHLGLGPAGAARVEADAAEAAALARFARVAWDARAEVARARVRLAAVRARRDAVQELAAEVRAELPRIAILLDNVRIGEAPARAARAMVAMLERRDGVLADVESNARATLARAAGLDPSDPALDVPGPDSLRAMAESSRADGDALSRAHPVLAEARLQVALQEARVRRAAAASWPGLDLGPHLAFPTGDLSDSFNLGGILQLTLPWPSSWRGVMEGRLEEREAAVEGYVDALVALRSAERDAAERLASASGRSRTTTPAVHHAAEAVWDSARSLFRVGRRDLEHWMQALRDHAACVTMPADDLEAIALARIDLAWSAGPPELEDAPEVTP